MHAKFRNHLNRYCAPIVFLMASICASGCANAWGSEVHDELTPQSWAGSFPHVQLGARLHGAKIRHKRRLDSTSRAEESAQCERAYPVPGEGVLSRISVMIPWKQQGQEYELLISIERDDLYERIGSSLTFNQAEGISAQLLEPGSSSLKVRSGRIEIAEISGTDPELPSVLPEGKGRFGAYFQLQLENGDWIRGSFSAPCTKNTLG